MADAVWTDEELDQAIADQPEGPAFGEAARARALSTMLDAADGPGEPGAEEPTIAPRSGKRWLVAAAVVVPLVAGGAFAAQPLLSGGGTPAATAATALQRAATSVTDDAPPGPGQYQYVAEHSWDVSSGDTGTGKPLTALQHTVRQTWIPVERSREWLRRQQALDAKWLVGSDELVAAEGAVAGMLDPIGLLKEERGPCGDFPSFNGELGGTPDDGKPCGERVGSWHYPRPPFLASLPQDPQALYDALRVEADGNASTALNRAVWILQSPDTSRDLRAALYLALQRLPGLVVTEGAANLNGRVGVALGVEGEVTRDEMIVDPTTGRLIGRRSVLKEDGTGSWEGLRAGTVVESSAVDVAVVDRMGIEP